MGATLLMTALLVVVSPAPHATAEFMLKECGGPGAQLGPQMLSPDPITGSAAAMPFRWEITHDSVTGDILTTEFHFGAPVGNSSAFLVRWPSANNILGSTTYQGAPLGAPVAVGTYGVNNITVDGLTTSWTVKVLQELSSANVGHVNVVLQREVLNTWIEFPAAAAQNIDDLAAYTAPGDYYIKVDMVTPDGSTYLCSESYVSTAEGSTAPLVLRPVAPKCQGLAITVLGTSGKDTLTGTTGPDVISGFGGNDTINGKGGNDVICGGEGNDTLDGSDGKDKLDGGSGTDTVKGGSGDDTLIGGTGNDTLDGGSNNDSVDGGEGADQVNGGSDKDHLVGGSGSPDKCDGGSGTDTGGAGCESVKSVP
jgi:Ca2+-binding RTX toxin-like protein